MRPLSADEERAEHALREEICAALQKRRTLPKTRFFHIDKDADISEFWGFLMGHILHATIIPDNKLILFQTCGDNFLTTYSQILFTPSIMIRYGDARTNKRIPLELIFERGDSDISIELTSVLMRGWFGDRWCEVRPETDAADIDSTSLLNIRYIPHATWTRYHEIGEPEYLKQLLTDLCARVDFDKEVSFVETKDGYPISFKYQFV